MLVHCTWIALHISNKLLKEKVTSHYIDTNAQTKENMHAYSHALTYFAHKHARTYACKHIHKQAHTQTKTPTHPRTHARTHAHALLLCMPIVFAHSLLPAMSVIAGDRNILGTVRLYSAMRRSFFRSSICVSIFPKLALCLTGREKHHSVSVRYSRDASMACDWTKSATHSALQVSYCFMRRRYFEPTKISGCC